MDKHVGGRPKAVRRGQDDALRQHDPSAEPGTSCVARKHHHGFVGVRGVVRGITDDRAGGRHCEPQCRQCERDGGFQRRLLNLARVFWRARLR